MNRRENAEIILKLQMILGVKGLKGILYVQILLQKIRMSRQLFLYDIEEGKEAFIPKDLS